MKHLCFKFLVFSFSLFTLTVISSSCDNTVKILAPYKDITVVYGLLDQSDSVHYFRINKAFEGLGNAYTMAQVYDSIYYPVGNIRAYIQDSSILSNSIVDTFNLDTTTAIALPPGVFSYPKQLLYYTQAHRKPLNQNDYYNLIIINTKTGKRITGSATPLPDINFTHPAGFLSSTSFLMSNDTAHPSSISWTTVPNARIYQMVIRFFYTETYLSVATPKSIDWIFTPITSPTLGGELTLSYSFQAQGLLTTIASLPYKEGITRTANYISVIFTTGSDDLNTYVQLSQPPLGLNQDIPSFTDLKNGIGLYTARHIETIPKLIDPGVLDSLSTEPRFIALGF
jgi:hypothetical protein